MGYIPFCIYNQHSFYEKIRYHYGRNSSIFILRQHEHQTNR